MRRRAAIVAVAVASLAACAADPCAEVRGACVALRVTSSTVVAVDQLDLDVTWGSAHGAASTPATAGARTRLPLSTAVSIDPLAGATPVRIQASGVLGGAVVGRGEVGLTLSPGQHASTTLTLGAPDDGGLPVDGSAPSDAVLAPDLASCAPGGLYCGGDLVPGDTATLYGCVTGGAPMARGVCSGGCIVRQPSQDDTCRGAGGACATGGAYCGGDKLVGDPMTLYRCDGSPTPPVIMVCPNGCVVRAGQDDICG